MSALSALAYGVFVIDENRRLTETNGAGEGILQQQSVLTTRAGRLAAVELGDHVRLEAAVAAAAARSAPKAATLSVGREGALVLDVLPLVGHRVGQRVMVLARDGVADGSVERRLQQLFGLTSAEAALAAELGRGAELADVAQARGVAISTVRTQLRAVASKLDVSRQSQVAAVVASLPPLTAQGLHARRGDP